MRLFLRLLDLLARVLMWGALGGLVVLGLNYLRLIAKERNRRREVAAALHRRRCRCQLAEAERGVE